MGVERCLQKGLVRNEGESGKVVVEVGGDERHLEDGRGLGLEGGDCRFRESLGLLGRRLWLLVGLLWIGDGDVQRGRELDEVLWKGVVEEEEVDDDTFEIVW